MNAIVQLHSSANDQATQPGFSQDQLRLEQVSIRLGQGSSRFVAVSDVTISVKRGEFVCLIGPSGCGKSTLLGAIAGHLPVTDGRLALDGRPIAGPDPRRGLVFQHHTLFPWLNVLDNVAYGLKMRGVSRSERHREARALIQRIGLQGFEGRYPFALSGGMQQRVEIARILINKPEVLLMDEPFGALDALTRMHMQELLLELWEDTGTTVLFVTHDIDEALRLADRVIVMSPRPGRIIEEIRVEQSRPRNTDWLTSERFSRLKRRCLALLHEHASMSLARLNPLTGVDSRAEPDSLDS